MIEQHPPISAPEPVTLTLSPEELRVVRTALLLLLETYTRHERMYPIIHAILARLPKAEAH
jgi:hypothetical protein